LGVGSGKPGAEHTRSRIVASETRARGSQLAKTMNVQDLKRALPTSTAPLVPALGERPTTRFMGSDTAADIVEAEILNGFRAWRVWTILGWDDIRQRYRRSILGPFWITLSMGVFILLLGVIYGRLFHMDLPTYLPYLSLGFIVWGFMSAVANDSCVAFHESGRIIKQIKLPFAIYIFRAVYRNFIVFLHTIIIFIPIAIYFRVAPNWNTLLALPGLFLVVVNAAWVATVLATFSTRYRDIQPIVSTMVQLVMFATPIMWTVGSLGNATIVAEINPIYHLIEIVRSPMLGSAPELRSWLVAGGLALVGSLLATALLVSKSRRIVFWL
jgi:ABC-type polysaccharide/polyol phosphate export permease